MSLVSYQWLSEHIDYSDLVIIDTRPKVAYMYGHIPNSILVPFTDGVGQAGFLFNKKESLQNLFAQKHIPSDKEVICYCSHGHRASSLSSS